MFEQAFKNIDDILWKEAGCGSELDYTEQASWLLFLRYLDALETQKSTEAELRGETYTKILEDDYSWSFWAKPKTADGKDDLDLMKQGNDLINFVNDDLFPYLKSFKEKATSPDTIEYKIGEIFGEIRNKFASGYSLQGVINEMDTLEFNKVENKHELSELYEVKIKNMGNAGRNGGEYYTPRPLIRAMINVIDPNIGETIYDGACGSGGFLCEAFDYLNNNKKKSTDDMDVLQKSTFYGKEKKSLAYVIGIMNMILHGIEAPNIIHTNTLSENIADIQESERYNIVLANPPFGGKEHTEVQQNFPIRTGETASLFLQHFIKSIKAGGRGAVVIKNTFLSNTGTADISLRKELLETCNLHTVLSCPQGTFIGAGVQTVVLFFEKGKPTKKTWFYELDPGRKMGKTNPLNDNDLKEFVKLQKSFADGEKSWTVNIADVPTDTYDLSVKNPNTPEAEPLREPAVILKSLKDIDKQTAELLGDIEGVV